MQNFSRSFLKIQPSDTLIPLKNQLSSKIESLLDLPELERLKFLYNSNSSYTKPFNHLSTTRYQHSAHSASQVRQLSIDINTHERIVLEAALLFHDIGHTPGSHSMDYIFSSMTNSPDIHSWGFGKNEFHEYHGAELIGKGESTQRIRDCLGKWAFGDLMSVLTFDDKRTHKEKCECYGEFTPSLAPHRIHQLYELKETLDRTSYLQLDYSTAGYKPEMILNSERVLEKYKKRLFLDSKDVIVLRDTTDVTDSFEDILQLRRNHFMEIAGHPLNQLVVSFLQKSIWRKIQSQEDFIKNPYLTLKNDLLSGQYHKVFDQETMEFLFGESKTCLIDRIVPMVTIDESMLTVLGKKYLEVPDKFYPNLTRSLCDVPEYKVSLAELHLNYYLKLRGINATIYFIVTNRIDKPFEYITGNKVSTQLCKHEPKENVRQIIVAADCIEQNWNDIKKLKSIVEEYFVKCGWVPNNFPFYKVYCSRVFVDPVTQSKFSDECLDKIKQIEPMWMKKYEKTLF